jgi:hypothetical protein
MNSREKISFLDIYNFKSDNNPEFDIYSYLFFIFLL